MSPENIGERPYLDVSVPAEFRIIFDRFSRAAVSRAGETQQAIADMRAGHPPLRDLAPITENIEEMLALTGNGMEINYDRTTVKALIEDSDYSAAAGKFRELDKTDERNRARADALIREVSLLALSIYTDRAERYHHQPKRKKGRVA